jgi:serralysin
MATPSDITVTPLTGLNHIDALLDIGPDWNYLTNGNANVLFYTFSITSGNEDSRTGQEAFSAAQQAAGRTAFSYLQQLTGIVFQETASGTGAQFHLANLNLEGQYTTGLNSWRSQLGSTDTTDASFSANAYVYLDNVEWRAMTQNLTVGGQGYETLLHELGHALGLKHPFLEPGGEAQVVLASSEDNTSNTIMSYNTVGGWHSTYSPYDVAALNWLYGRDGLRGDLGINSTTGARYLTGSYKAETLVGTQFNDTLQGNGGNDMIDGGAGTDTVIFNGNRSAYAFTTLADGSLAVSSAQDGTDTLSNVELLQFADMRVERANVVADTTAPVAPVLAVTQNAKDYATTGNVIAMNGSAEANSTVRVYIGDKVIATAVANAAGLWTARATEALPEGLGYRAFATATDAANNVSVASNQVMFHIDSIAPSVPTLNVALAAGGNRPLFTGTGEAGSTIELYRDGDFTKIGTATVGGDGKWAFASHPMPNGNYNVIVTSLDAAGNARAGQVTSALTINHNGYQAGTTGADTVVINAGSNAFDGGAGLDVAVYSGSRDAYTIKKETWGYSVTAPNGEVDGLFNVERVKFADGWKAIDETSAQIFRLYEAVLNRAAEEKGLGYWNWRMDNGTSLQQVATEFMKQPEFYALYGQNPSDEKFIEALYLNVLGREPDVGGELYWTQAIGVNGRAQTLIDFAESPENKALVIDIVGQGLDFVPWQG